MNPLDKTRTIFQMKIVINYVWISKNPGSIYYLPGIVVGFDNMHAKKI
jgi:hypothetical protein